MKNKLWLLSIPIILLFSLLQTTFDWGEQGKLQSSFLRNEIFPFAKNVNGIMTNIKFKIRGPQKPNPNIVIVAADETAVDKLGRWPWHREVYALIIDSIFKLGAKHVATDVVFSEPEERIPDEVLKEISAVNPKLKNKIQEELDGDGAFALIMNRYRENLVLGYIPSQCQPIYDPQGCPVDNQKITSAIKDSIGKFALNSKSDFTLEQIKSSPLLNILSGVFPIPLFMNAVNHAGFFYVTPDPDGYIRKYPLVLSGDNFIYPSLALKMAELALQDELKVNFTKDARIENVYFSKSPNNPIPSTKLGFMDLNFKGPSQTFPYISAFDVMRAESGQFPMITTKIESLLKGKEVFFGVSAIGLYDMRAFPFDPNTPGVEGHATALNNLLSMDALKSASAIHKEWLPLTLIIVIGIVFAFLFSSLDAVPGLLLFGGFVLGFGYLDIQYLFGRNINLPTALLYFETFTIFAFILSLRYVLEEKKKKHIKQAFSHYLAPSVVEMVLKDPSKLAVGGERRDLTILFSDLRGFTAISEGMDPKTLSQFLNEYLTAMTDCVFENEGTLDKYIGDAVMAFWGAPIQQEDHILRACIAGINMQKRLASIAPEFKKKYNIDVGMGVGINTGTVSVGNMGSAKIFEYTVLGDHVNLASRLEGLTRLYGVGVLSTKSTMDILNQKYPGKVFYRVLDSVKVKGKKIATELVEIALEPFSEEASVLFQKARESFMRQEWDQAIQLFSESNNKFLEKHGHIDSVSDIFISRCEQFKIRPPEEGWDGSIEMRSK